MLTINNYEISFAQGESIQIEFNIEPIDLGTLSGEISAYFQYTRLSPRFKKSKIIERKLEKVGKSLVLDLNTVDTYNMEGPYLWGLRLTNGANNVFPILNERLLVRRLGNDYPTGIPCAIEFSN